MCVCVCRGGGGLEIIDCKNSSIPVALPFNKEFYNRVSSKIGRRALRIFLDKNLSFSLLTQTFLFKANFTKC